MPTERGSPGDRDAAPADASAEAGVDAGRPGDPALDVPADGSSPPIDPTDPAPTPPSIDDAGPDAAQPSVGDADVEPPRLESISPAASDGPVSAERVRLRFSEAMSRSSVEAAFPTGDSFTWSDDGSSVEFHLPLPFAASREPFDIVVPGAVRDEANNPLGADVRERITLAGLAHVVLPLNFGMTGNKIGGDVDSYAFLLTGDVAGGRVHYGAASFSLADLPSFSMNLGLRQATVHLQVCGVEGNPGEALGGIEVARVKFESRLDIDGPISVPGGDLGTLIAPGLIVPGQLVELDVAASLTAAWEAGESLFQLRFAPHSSNNNGVADAIYLRRVVDENNAVISDGVLDPDPDNAARIEVEFFY